MKKQGSELLRVIAGTLRGRTLKAPAGMTTRPTTDRVRESLMSSLSSLLGGFDGAYILDAFAGSGALGIESISRGAAYVCAFERDARTFATLRENAQLVDAGRLKLIRGDITSVRPVTTRPFDLVFLDPPYAMNPEEVFRLIDSWEESGLLSDEVVISYEHARKDEAQVSELFQVQGWEIHAIKNYGETQIHIGYAQ